jgi:hypothetical protein
MMVLTHAAVGLALAVPVAFLAPEYGSFAAWAGVVGGTVPDLDLPGEHRRTLHFPLLGAVPTAIAGAVAAVAPSPTSVGVAAGWLAFWVHGASDALGAGEELRPWRRTNTDAVYCHATSRWLRARYAVPYDGHPRDVLVAGIAVAPAVAVFGPPLRWVAVGLVAVGAVYALVRKRIPAYVAPLVES